MDSDLFAERLGLRCTSPSLSCAKVDLQKGTVNMREILLMIALGPWLIGVGIVAYFLLRKYSDY